MTELEIKERSRLILESVNLEAELKLICLGLHIGNKLSLIQRNTELGFYLHLQMFNELIERKGE